MTNRDFNTLWSEALVTNDRDRYIAEWATSSIFDPDPDAPAPDYEAVIKTLGNIWDVAHMTFAEIRKHAGLNQAAFAERFCISRRTLEGWEGRSRCPDYVRLMMADILGLISR